MTQLVSISSAVGQPKIILRVPGVAGPSGPGSEGGVIDGDKGDITVSNDGITWTINEESVGNAELANMAGQTIKARVQSDAGEPQDATASEIRTLLNVEDGAQANVLPDWIAESGSARILNKPVLGGAAALGVGTTAGTVAAGDDARLSDSREWNAATIEQAEAEAGTGTTRRAFTAQRVFQAIVAWWAASSAKTKLDGIETGAQVNVATNLTYDAPTREVRSSTGTDATLPLVSTSTAGLQAPTGFGSITYAAQVALDLAVLAGQVNTITLTGALELTTSNLANGRVTGLRLIPGASARNLTFPADWKFVSAKPASLPANKIGRLTIECHGTTNADVIAAIAIQP